MPPHCTAPIIIIVLTVRIISGIKCGRWAVGVHHGLLGVFCGLCSYDVNCHSWNHKLIPCVLCSYKCFILHWYPYCPDYSCSSFPSNYCHDFILVGVNVVVTGNILCIFFCNYYYDYYLYYLWFPMFIGFLLIVVSLVLVLKQLIYVILEDKFIG